MSEIANLLLNDARPDHQVHLLIWNTPNDAELEQLAFYNNAHRVNYRDNLLKRIDPRDKYLNLHYYLERELDAIKSICVGVNKSMVLLEGLDCLITYLRVKPNSPLTVFWYNLETTRKLEKLLWIILPNKLAPPNWEKRRIRYIP